MDATLKEVEHHIEEVTKDPSKKLDGRTLGKLDTNIIENLPSSRRTNFINLLAALLPTLQQDPTSAAELAAVLVDNDDTLSFAKVLQLEPAVDLVGGLETPISSLNKLTLALLHKATSVADVGLVASKPDVVIALVRLWLRTSHTVVTEKARKVLNSLLRAERSGNNRGDGSPILPSSQALMWRRIFNDRDVYGLLFSLCSVKTLGDSGQLTRREKTIAQGRLLDLIQGIRHAPQIWRSQIPEIEEAYGVSPGAGLLEFAAVHMVDWKDDVLIHMNLIDFFTRLISLSNGDNLYQNPASAANFSHHSSEALDFLISKGLHERTISYFLEPDKHDSLDATYLYSSSTSYISAYARHYPTHFIKLSAKPILARLSSIISNVQGSAWANNQAPAHDLKLLSNLPQQALLSVDNGALVRLIPNKRANVEALHTLGAIFKGPQAASNGGELETPVPSRASQNQNGNSTKIDQAAARVLALLYMHEYPGLWQSIIDAAQTPSLKENALAAVGFLHAVVDSSWAPLPSQPSDLPNEVQLENQCLGLRMRPLPEHGVLALLQPPAMGSVMPFLMNGPENSSEAAWEIAVAKHGVVKLMNDKLGKLIEDNDPAIRDNSDSWDEILQVLAKREQQGPGGQRERGGTRRNMPVVGTIGR